MREALQKIESLDLPDARRILTEILTIDPKHGETWRQLFNIDKLSPATERFHQTAAKRLQLLSAMPGEGNALIDTYRQYKRLADRPRLSADMILRLAALFSRMGHIDEAMDLNRQAMSIAPGHPRLPESLLELAESCGRANQLQRRDAVLKVLVEKYPQTPEAARGESLR